MMRKEALAQTVSKRVVLTLFAALLAAVATLLGLGMVQADAQTSPAYTIKDLKDLGTLNLKPPNGSGYESSYAYGVNDAGQVAGEYVWENEEDEENPFTDMHGFIRQDNGDSDTTNDLKDLGHLGTPKRTVARAVNDSGQVVGSSYADSKENSGDSGGPRAFLYDEKATTKMKDLGKLSGEANHSDAKDINDSGQVVGTSYTTDNVTESYEKQAFLYENGVMNDIGTNIEIALDGVRDSVPLAINDEGQIVGYAIDSPTQETPEPRRKAFLYSNGTVTDLVGLPGSISHVATDINNAGHVVGESSYDDNIDNYNDPSKAFLYKDGQMQDLGKLSGYDSMSADTINDAGQIIGSAQKYDDPNTDTWENAYTPALYDGGQWIDLNSLLPADKSASGWQLLSAEAISNKDSQNQVQIVGGARVVEADGTGATHAYLMTLDVGSGSASSGDETVTKDVTASGPPATTDAENDGATAADPIETSVGGANGKVTITEKTSVDQSVPSGYSLFDGQQVDIQAPAGTVDNPLAIKFTIDKTLAQQNGLTLPDDINSLVVFRNGAAVSQECLGATKALADNSDGTPNPCVSKREMVGNGADADAVITVLTTKASKWNLGKPKAYSFKGFFQPVDNAPMLNKVKAGSAVPVKFSLGGDKGLNIFAANYPKSQQVTTGSQAAVDAIEQTTTATSNNLSYDAASGQYTYVFKTEKSWANTDRELVLKFNDGSEQKVANFKFTGK